MSFSEELVRFRKLNGQAAVKCSDACLLILRPFVDVFLKRNGLEPSAGWSDLAAALESGVSHSPMSAQKFLATFDQIMFDADLFDGWYDMFTQDALLGLDDGLRFLAEGDIVQFESMCATVVNVVLKLAEYYPQQVALESILADLPEGNLAAARDFARRVENGLYSE